MSTETVAHESFDLLVFWYRNRRKILLYLGVLGAVLTTYGVAEFSKQREIARSQALYATAVTAEDFQKVIQSFPGSRVAGNAALRLADKQREAKDYDASIATLRAFIEKSPTHPLAAGAWNSLAASYEFKGDLDKALDTYQQLSAKYPNAYVAPAATFAQGRVLAKLGKVDEARRAFQDVMSRYQESLFAMQASRELRALPRGK
jgi:TolA-binding protein